MSEASVEILIPPARVRDVERLMLLQADGFIPPGAIHFSPDVQSFRIQLEGDAVSHLLELLAVASGDRNSETWQERRERQSSQLRMQFDPADELSCADSVQAFL